MAQNNSEKVKSECDFLKHDANLNHDYQLVKSGKSVYNFKKHQLYNTTHNPIQNFFINPKNNYPSKPFGANSNTYIDFELPQIQYTFYQFVLRFRLQNAGTVTQKLMPSPFIIDRISLLRNSNTFGIDVDSIDVLHYNLNKYFKEVEVGRNLSNVYANLGLQFGSGVLANNLSCINFDPTAMKDFNVELPISLNRSLLPACLIKDNLIIRVYFKNDIVYDGSPADMVLSDVNLVLRMEELNNNQLAHLYKQPKFNHMFNKRIVQRFNINKLDAGIEVSVPLAGFRSIAGGLLAYLSYPLNDIKSANHGGYQYHLYQIAMDNVYIVDGTGRNIQNNNKQTKSWNNYLLPQKFGTFSEALNLLCVGDNNNENRGMIYYIPFCADGSDPYNGVYSGGYSFNTTSDHVFKFVPDNSYNGNVLLNVISFTPALISLEGGSLNETYG